MGHNSPVSRAAQSDRSWMKFGHSLRRDEPVEMRQLLPQQRNIKSARRFRGEAICEAKLASEPTLS